MADWTWRVASDGRPEHVVATSPEIVHDSHIYCVSIGVLRSSSRVDVSAHYAVTPTFKTARGGYIRPSQASASASKVAPALAYVAGEVRAEMVARGLAEAEPDELARAIEECQRGIMTREEYLARREAEDFNSPAGLTVTSDTPGVPR
jgi:hypothetical protein